MGVVSASVYTAQWHVCSASGLIDSETKTVVNDLHFDVDSVVHSHAMA